MSTTVGATIERTRGRLSSFVRTEVNTLDANINSSVTTLTCDQPVSRNLATGSVICIGLEAMRVVAVDTVTRVVTVVRGAFGTTATAHTAGDEIQADNRFASWRILDAMIDELGSWGDRIFRVETHEFTVADGTETLALPADFIDAVGIISVRRLSNSGDTTAWPHLPYRVQRGDTTWSAAPASGLLLRFTDGAVASGTVAVTAAFPMVAVGLTESSDLVTDHHVPSSAIDVLSLGVRIRLMIDAEMTLDQRDVMDDMTRPGERPPYQWPAGVQSLYALYRRRLQEESDRIRSKYPMTSQA